MLFVVEERREGLEYNIDFGGGVGVHRGSDRFVDYAKKVDLLQVDLL